MNIKLTKEINAFFDRCQNNINEDYQNDFLGAYVNPKNERQIQEALKKAKHPEFMGPPTTWPSLFISSEAFLNTPFHQQITLDTIKSKQFQYTTETMIAHELFNLSSIQPDPKRELKDYMKLRALDAPYDAAILLQDGNVWMLDVPSEAATIDPCAAKASGNVLTFGLGIGYFIYMAMLNPKVTSITVVEQSQEVIEMFQTYLYPQFPQHIKVNFICGDAFDYFNEATIASYDYVFVDIWRSNDDGFALIQALLEQYLPPFEKVDFWIEYSCFEFITTLMFYYFYHLARNKKSVHHDPYYQTIYRKIDTYFKNINRVIDQVDDLKFYLYDLETIRAIIATNV